MKQLTSSRGWEYAYEKELEEQLARLRRDLEERAEGRDLAQFQYLCGKIRGIRMAIDQLTEIREKYRLDDDVDLAS